MNLLELIRNTPVEWKELGEVANIKNGRDWKKLGKGDTPVYGSGGIMSYVDTSSYDKVSVLIPRKGTITNIFYVEGPFWNVDTIFYTEINEEIVVPKYLYYFMKNYDLTSLSTESTRPSLTQGVLNKIKIPIPPKEIQEKIVGTLEKITKYVTELTAELTAELTYRNKQYVYYRDLLLSEKSLAKVGFEWKILGGEDGVGSFIRGNGMQKKDFVKEGFPAIHYGQIYTKYGLEVNETFTFVLEELASKLKKARTGDLIIATTSENDEDVCKALAWSGDEVAISGDMMLFRHGENVKFLAYYFQTEAFQYQKRKYITGTKVRRVSSDSLSKISVPLPSLPEQARIVEILDKFDTLNNSISEGLSKEIDLRQKQYEYYRNLLLGFTQN